MNDSHPLFARRLTRAQLIMLDVAAGWGLSLLFLTAALSVAELPLWVRFAVPLGLGLPLALRRVFPLPVFLVTLLVAGVAVLIGAVSFAYVSPAYALYVVAVAESRGTWLPTTAIGVVAVITGLTLVVAGATPQTAAPAWLLSVDKMLIGFAALGGAWTAGRALRERRIHAAHAAERMAAQAVAEERLRIARELHDVVTHNVGLIAVKAGVANHVLPTRPEEAHDALRVIETASRSALVEMRHLLGVLRSADTPALDPAPGLDGLAALAEQARSAGVGVELDVHLSGDDGDGREARSRTGPREAGGGRRLPEGVELSVYRIVQEALTNVVKHAAPAHCRVSVVDDGRSVRIEVKDDGPGHRASPGEGLGHGLIGMRERVMMYGGAFEAVTLPQRGFRVSADLPYGRVS